MNKDIEIEAWSRNIVGSFYLEDHEFYSNKIMRVFLWKYVLLVFYIK